MWHLIASLVACAWAVPAFAHGEDLLRSVYAQLAAVLVTFVALGVVPALRKHRIAGVVGCLLGVVGSWLATFNLPYQANHVSVTVLLVALPLALAMIAIAAARHRAAK